MLSSLYMGLSSRAFFDWERTFLSARTFLSKRLDPARPLLLGLSGGPDSTCLLYLLKQWGYQVHLAHIDHGWRSESGAEAASLAERAEALGCPFYLYRLEESLSQGGNLEDRAREERLHFFYKLYRKEGFQAVLTAHHKGDQVETVLKRVCEGAPLVKMGGIERDGLWQEMPLLRPLLGSSKEEIVNWLKDQGISYFEDRSNHDERFQRVRMRKRILPDLEEAYGKNISHNLALLGERAGRLRRYLDRRVAPLILSKVEGPMGFYIDLHQESLRWDLFEIEHAIRSLIHVSIRREEMEELLGIIEEGRSNKKVLVQGIEIIFDRGRLFFIEKKMERKPLIRLDSLGNGGGWQAYWQGTLHLTLPEGAYLAPAPLTARLAVGHTIKEWYVKNEVPAFLRSLVPVIWLDDRVIGECLTGKFPYKSSFDLNVKKAYS